jgi:hypothetical protein
MNRVIPNGSICMFKPYYGGSNNGKIVLVENIDIQDQDFNSALLLTYSSEKVVTEEGHPEAQINCIETNSFDSSYKNIIINEENGPENERLLVNLYQLFQNSE